MNKDIFIFSWKCTPMEVDIKRKRYAPANETYFPHIITTINETLYFSKVI